MIILILILFTALPVFAQGDSLWSINLGHGDGFSLVRTSDGGYAISGWEITDTLTCEDFKLVKTNSDGNIEWSRRYSRQLQSGRNERCYSLSSTQDNGFLLAGTARGSWVVRTDSTGEMLWSRYLGDEDSVGYLHTCAIAHDGNFLVGGGGSPWDALLIKLDDEGEVIWRRMYGGGGSETVHSIIPTEDGGYFLGGFTTSFGEGGPDMYAIKVDEDGELEWQGTYGTEIEERCWAAVQTEDGGYGLAGVSQPDANGRQDGIIVRIDAEGEELWRRICDLGDHEGLFAITDCRDGGFAAAGRMELLDCYFVHVDADGELLFQKRYDGGGGRDYCYSMLRTDEDGGFALGGQCQFVIDNVPRFSFWLLKLSMDILIWLGVPDTSFVQGSELAYDLKYFSDYLSPIVENDTLLRYEAIASDHVLGEIDDDSLRITAEEGWFGEDSLRLVVLERRNEENCDTTWLRLTVHANDFVIDNLINQTSEFKLLNAVPNPLNEVTEIRYEVPLNCHVKLSIFDVHGNWVKLISDGNIKAGQHSAIWNGTNETGIPVSSGLYFYRINAGNFTKVRKMTMVK